MDGKCNKTNVIAKRTIDFSPQSWIYYKDNDGEIFEWNEKKDGEPQFGIAVNQIQRVDFITPVDQYGFSDEDLDLYFKGVDRAPEMMSYNFGDMIGGYDY